jgi:hypothetical protein
LKRTLILGNLMLALVIGALAYGVWQRNRDALAAQQQVLNRKPLVKPETVPVPPRAAPATPQTYAAETVQHFLFAADRNPNVIVKTTAPPPQPVMPPLPAAYGEMFFGDPVILLSTRTSPQRGYRAGEMVDEFKLVDFDEEKVMFEWRDKSIERTLAELMKSQPAPSKAAQSAALAASGSTPAANSAATAASQASSQNTQGQPGQQISPTYRACIPSDTSPAGTVSSDGFTKKIVPTMFGNQCSWVK